MADAYWRYNDAREAPAAAPVVGKRPRSDYDVPAGREVPGYYPRDDQRVFTHMQFPSHGGPLNAGIPGHDPRAVGLGAMDPGLGVKGPTSSLGSRGSEIPLPSDATRTLYVEGLPQNCTRREVAHIFRPFVGYVEVRLVNKAHVLCFVDFETPAHAATAMAALQGYRFDERDVDSGITLQFARNPGAKSSGGHRGRR